MNFAWLGVNSLWGLCNNGNLGNGQGPLKSSSCIFCSCLIIIINSSVWHQPIQNNVYVLVWMHRHPLLPTYTHTLQRDRTEKLDQRPKCFGFSSKTCQLVALWNTSKYPPNDPLCCDHGVDAAFMAGVSIQVAGTNTGQAVDAADWSSVLVISSTYHWLLLTCFLKHAKFLCDPPHLFWILAKTVASLFFWLITNNDVLLPHNMLQTFYYRRKSALKASIQIKLSALTTYCTIPQF